MQMIKHTLCGALAAVLALMCAWAVLGFFEPEPTGVVVVW